MRKIAAALLLILPFLGLGGCATTQEEVGMPAPLVMSPADLEAEEITISSRRPLVIDVDDPEHWRGNVDDNSIVMFTSGEDHGKYLTNPAFSAVDVGTTGATLAGPNGEEIAFTIIVLPDAEEQSDGVGSENGGQSHV